jgi:hypothetical protein
MRKGVPISAAPPAFVDITWTSIANVYYELGTLKNHPNREIQKALGFN